MVLNSYQITKTFGTLRARNTTGIDSSFYCGTSNIVLPVPNKSHFPDAFKDKSRLAYYSSLFNTVEINSSFYKIPMPKTMERWSAEVPEDFRFTLKLWKGITHAKELAYDEKDLNRFMVSANALGRKKGCILLQLPASINISFFAKVMSLLSHLYTIRNQWKIAIEFRDRSWYVDNVYEMLEQLGISLVIHDMPASATPPMPATAAFQYYRFHGLKGDYKGSYDKALLKTYASGISDSLRSGLTVFAYFNNTIGDAVNNAATLAALIK